MAAYQQAEHHLDQQSIFASIKPTTVSQDTHELFKAIEGIPRAL